MSRTRHPSIRLRTRLPKKLCNIIYHFDTFTERDTKQNLEKEMEADLLKLSSE